MHSHYAVITAYSSNENWLHFKEPKILHWVGENSMKLHPNQLPLILQVL